MTGLGLSLGWSAREPVDRIVDLVRRAEESGLQAVWVVDSQVAMRDAYTLLAILARETASAAIGPGVTNLLTRHETVVANALATLAAVAPGRILAGVGAGDSAVFPIGLRPQKVAELERGVARLRALLAGEEVEGPAGPVRLASTPVPPPPIYLAASQPKMLDLAGAVADGVVVMGPADADLVARQLSMVREGARRAGRNPAAVAIDLWVTMAVGSGPDAVDAVRSWASAQARWLAGWAELPGSLHPFRTEMEEAAAAYDFSTHLSLAASHARTVPDDLARALAVVGTPEECARRLTELARLGPDRITISLLSGGRERRLEQILEVWESVPPRPAAVRS